MCKLNDSTEYKKSKCTNKLEIVFKNQNFSKKSFDSYADSKKSSILSILINCPITVLK